MSQGSETGAEKRGWLARLRAGLSRSSGRLSDGIAGIFTKRKLDDAALEELEELLITADLGVSTAAKLTAALAKEKFDKEVSPDEVRGALLYNLGRIAEGLGARLRAAELYRESLEARPDNRRVERRLAKLPSYDMLPRHDCWFEWSAGRPYVE